MANWKERLEVLIGDDSMKAVSRRASLGDTAVFDMLRRDRSPSIDNFIAVARAVGVSPAWLLSGDDQDRHQVPIVGIASAGDGWAPGDDGLEFTDFLLSGRDLIAVEVRGDSMFPVYRDGDMLICERLRGRQIIDFVGRDCVIQTTDGQHLVKQLKAATRGGLYRLKSYNQRFDDLDNVALAWAAPVLWIKRQ